MRLYHFFLPLTAQQAIASSLGSVLMPRQDAGTGTTLPRLVEPGFHIGNGYLFELWFDGWNLCPNDDLGDLLSPARQVKSYTAQAYWDELTKATPAQRVMMTLENWWGSRAQAKNGSCTIGTVGTPGVLGFNRTSLGLIKLGVTFSGKNVTFGFQSGIKATTADVGPRFAAAAGLAIIQSLLYEVSVWIHGHNQIPRMIAMALSVFGKALSPAIDAWNAELGKDCVGQDVFDYALGNMEMINLPDIKLEPFDGVLALGVPSIVDSCRPGAFQDSDLW